MSGCFFSSAPDDRLLASDLADHALRSKSGLAERVWAGAARPVFHDRGEFDLGEYAVFDLGTTVGTDLYRAAGLARWRFLCAYCDRTAWYE